MSNLSASSVAKIKGVSTRIIQNWAEAGRFPGAFKEKTEFYGEVWRIPEESLSAVDKPLRGRPKGALRNPRSK